MATIAGYFKFREFLDIIDRELKQKRFDNLTTVKDAQRLAKQAEVAQWVNQSLNYLSAINESFWRNNQEFIPATSSSEIELPFYWKRLDTIIISDAPHKVGIYSDLRYSYYHKHGHVLCSRGNEFVAGVPIVFSGIFRPIPLPTNGVDDDLEAVVDIDPDWINLLKLHVLIKYGGRENMQTAMWYGQYRDELEAFRRASPPVSGSYTWRNKVLWGEHF